LGERESGRETEIRRALHAIKYYTVLFEEKQGSFEEIQGSFAGNRLLLQEYKTPVIEVRALFIGSMALLLF